MTRLDIIKLRLKLADLPPLDLKPPDGPLPGLLPVVPLAPPGGSGPSNPNDVQEAILAANIALVAGQQRAYLVQQYFLELLTECCYQVSILSERFAAGYPEDETVYLTPLPEKKA